MPPILAWRLGMSIESGRTHRCAPTESGVGYANRMRYDPDKHHRGSIRLRDYDYAQPGAYFVTICTQGRLCLFGDVVDGDMWPNDARQMIKTWWAELSNKFPRAEPNECVVMPNHFHGIITLIGADLCVCPDRGARSEEGAPTCAPLPDVMRWFKIMTTNAYIRGVKQRSWEPFVGKLWQRRYYDHIIRNGSELGRIRQYSIDNPSKWSQDTDNPLNLGTPNL